MGTHPIFESDFDCLTETKLFVALFAFASAQKGCGRDCTKNLGANVELCEELYPGSDQAKDFVKCFTQASVNWANCLDACKPDPWLQKCTTTFDEAVNKCENANPPLSPQVLIFNNQTVCSLLRLHRN